MLTQDLIRFLDDLLQPWKYKDYCPNGLQIEGSSNIDKVICGVSLTEQLIDQAIVASAQAIVVHHGAFWQGDDYVITGYKYKRIAKLIKHNINLFAYHLPLDNHLQLGNNITLAQKLGLTNIRQASQQEFIWLGELHQPVKLIDFVATYTGITSHAAKFFGDQDKLISKIALCTGGAVSLFDQAIKCNVNLYLTGEIKENVMAQSLESGVAYLAGGHYVTERYGIMALSQYINDNLDLKSEFIELYNPI